MSGIDRKRIWGWMFFDWASQPYNTLLLTFVFSPYFATVVGDATRAQKLWGFGLTVAGLSVAVLAPLLGAVADVNGRRMPWIAGFSVLYMAGAFGLWWAYPDSDNVTWILLAFGIGFVGMEFATIFTNALLPDLGPRAALGRISGAGWAFGYAGGVLSLALMLLFLAENDAGVTFLGIEPILGLDPAVREGTRSVGPVVAIWYAVFMIPFFLWVRERPAPKIERAGRADTLRESLTGLWRTIRRLPRTRSLFAYLGAALFYRDALNGLYTFGGIYALGVLGWSVVDVGVFGILAAVTGAIFAWAGGHADSRFGPKPVIATCITVLLLVCTVVVTISQTSVLGLPVAPGSALPDIAFYVCGCLIGAAGGALQSASRTMMVRQADPDRMTEAFGLYALSGKSTTWLAPLLIAVVTGATDSQRLGVTPLIVLFLIGLILLVWVEAQGESTATWSEPDPSLSRR